MSRKKYLKIGLVIDDSLDSTAGVQQYVMAVGKWMAEAGHTVHYLTSETHRDDLPNIYSLTKKIRTNFNGNKGGGTPLPLSKRKAKKFNIQEEYDILHVQMPYSPFLAGQLIKTASKSTAIVGTFHIFPDSKLVAAATRALGVWVHRQLRRFDAVLSVSSAAQTFARQTFHIDSQVLPNMFDIRDFDIVPKKASDMITIAFLGRLVPRKGAKELLQAIGYIKNKSLADADFKVVIGGKGPMADELGRCVKDNDLSEIVEFTGFVAEEDKGQFLNAADISVFPSTGGESFGISLLEAMAATSGTVIAGDNAGYRTVMSELPDQLVNPSDTAAFAELLARHINSATLRTEARERQRVSVKQYDRGIVCKEIESVYYEALQKRSP